MKIGNVVCTDISEMYAKKAPDYEGRSPENKFFEKHFGTLPTTQVIGKYAKNHAWSIVSAAWNFTDNSIDYVLLVNQNDTKPVHVTKEQLCEEFNWKGFKVKGQMSVIPEEMTAEEITFKLKDSLAKGKRTLAKIAKKLAEEPTEQNS